MPQGTMTVEDHEIVEHMEHCGDPAFTASELAEHFGMTTNGMRQRLDKIRESGEIENKKPTKRTVIWWHKDDYSEPVLSR